MAVCQCEEQWHVVVVVAALRCCPHWALLCCCGCLCAPVRGLVTCDLLPVDLNFGVWWAVWVWVFRGWGLGVQVQQPTEQKFSNEHTHNLVLGKTENGRNPFRRSSEIFDL